MQFESIAIYFLGAFTFWPLVGVALYLYFPPSTQSSLPRLLEDGPESKSAEQTKQKHRNATYLSKQLREVRDPSLETGLSAGPDFESDTEASGWIRVAPAPVITADFGEDVEPAKSDKPSNSARLSLRKFISGPFGMRTKPESVSEEPAQSSSSSVYSLDSVVEESRPKSVSKCPRFWGVVRGGQLQLFEDKYEHKFMRFITLPKHVAMIWPQDLQEFELFYRRYPIALVSRMSPEGLVSLDLAPGQPPRDAIYIYVENPVEKEDLYFALVKESSDTRNLDSAELSELHNSSLGPRDPEVMARPLRARKLEAQKLQSLVWSSQVPGETQWLNALVGRMFLALKDTPLIDDYLRRKFSYKLKPISRSSNIIGDIEVRSIFCGDAAPHIDDIKLRELTPEGSLILHVSINYNGSFRVNLGTTVKLAAVTSLTNAQIPIELAATVKSIRGVLVLCIKPAPSERIWYAFDTMPEVDLVIEPVVYETQISLSMVTNFIKNKLLDSLKESLVMPYMDDFVFYNTEGLFYRGGIWEPEPSIKAQMAKMKPRKKEDEKKRELKKEGIFSNGLSSGAGTASGSSSIRSQPQVARRQPETESLDKLAAGETVSDAASTKSTFRSFGSWMSRKRSNTSLRRAKTDANEVVSPPSPAVQPQLSNPKRRSSNASIASLSPRKLSGTTTQVTTETASGEPGSPDRKPVRTAVRRKPVPNSDFSLPELEPQETLQPAFGSTPGPAPASIPGSSSGSISGSPPPPRSDPVVVSPPPAPALTSELDQTSSGSPPMPSAGHDSLSDQSFASKGSEPDESIDLKPRQLYHTSANADTTAALTKATLVKNNEHRRASSAASLHSLISDTASIASSARSQQRSTKSRGPQLPPRRRTVMLQNVPPEGRQDPPPV